MNEVNEQGLTEEEAKELIQLEKDIEILEDDLEAAQMDLEDFWQRR